MAYFYDTGTILRLVLKDMASVFYLWLVGH